MRVSDLDETIKFYTSVLGLEVIEHKTSPRGSHLAFLKVPNSDELIELTSFPQRAGKGAGGSCAPSLSSRESGTDNHGAH